MSDNEQLDCRHVWSTPPTATPLPTLAHVFVFVECLICHERVDVGIALEDLSVRIAALESLTGGAGVARVGAYGVRLRLRDGSHEP